MITQAAPSLRVCIEAEDGRYIAQCVDYDISGEGTTPELAVDHFIDKFIKTVLIAVHVGAKPLENIPPAPQAYVDLWRYHAQRGESVFVRRIPPFSTSKHGNKYVFDTFGAVEAALPADVAA